MKIINGISEIADQYDVVFCDLWGCLHNGVTPFPEAVLALEQFKAKGGYVLLLTNSPRPMQSVIQQLEMLGIARDQYDNVASSGESTQMSVALKQFGQKVFHLGPERDRPFFDVSELGVPDITPVELVPLDQADSIICTGLFDDAVETPDDYRAIILDGVNRNLKLVCANPDIIVDHGDHRIFCAGAIAKAYTEAGGQSFYFGKPHPPIYDLAKRKLIQDLGSFDDSRILCIGDGIGTDILGGNNEILDTAFITGGLANEATGTYANTPDKEKLDFYLNEHQIIPTYSLGHLRW